MHGIPADALQLEIKQGVEARQALEREMAEQASVHSKQLASAEQGRSFAVAWKRLLSAHRERGRLAVHAPVHKMEVLGLQQRMAEEVAQLQARLKASSDEVEKVRLRRRCRVP